MLPASLLRADSLTLLLSFLLLFSCFPGRAPQRRCEADVSPLEYSKTRTALSVCDSLFLSSLSLFLLWIPSLGFPTTVTVCVFFFLLVYALLYSSGSRFYHFGTKNCLTRDLAIGAGAW